MCSPKTVNVKLNSQFDFFCAVPQTLRYMRKKKYGGAGQAGKSYSKGPTRGQAKYQVVVITVTIL